METRSRAFLNPCSHEASESSHERNCADDEQNARENEKNQHHAAIQNRRFSVVLESREVGRADFGGLVRVEEKPL